MTHNIRVITITTFVTGNIRLVLFDTPYSDKSFFCGKFVKLHLTVFKLYV